MGYASAPSTSRPRDVTLVYCAMAGQNEDDYNADRRRADPFDGHRLELRRWRHADRAVDRPRRRSGVISNRARRASRRSTRNRFIDRPQQYLLVDAATGDFESGYVKVVDMVTRQPWDDNVPVRRPTAVTTSTPAEPVLIWTDEDGGTADERTRARWTMPGLRGTSPTDVAGRKFARQTVARSSYWSCPPPLAEIRFNRHRHRPRSGPSSSTLWTGGRETA